MKMSYIVKQGFKEWYKFPLFELARHNQSFLSLIPFRPAAACINVTHNCNSRCVTCTMWKEKSTDELTMPEICDIMTQMREMGVRRVGFSGGEPLLRRDLPEMVKKARELGFERISVLSNGLLLNQDRARELVENGVNAVSISLDGFEETNDRCRGVKGSYQKCMKALKMLASLRDNGYRNLDVMMATTLMQPTIGQAPKLLEMAKGLGVNWTPNLIETVSFQFQGIDAADLVIRDKAEIDEVVGELHQMKRRYPMSNTITHMFLEMARGHLKGEKSTLQKGLPCIAGYTCIYLDAHGNIYPGCWALAPVGNIREKTLKEIACGEKYKERLRQQFVRDCPFCTNSYLMSVWYHIPSLIREAWWRLKLLV